MLMEMDYTLKVNDTTYPNMLASNLKTSPDPYSCAAGSHGICVLTEWDEFKTLDYVRIYESMAKPAFIFDGRMIMDHKALVKIGFEVYCIGKPRGGGVRNGPAN